MNRYIVSVLVANKFGVLNRVTSMFRRRQFNIRSLTVSETESYDYSRITVTYEGDINKKQQLINQLYKLPDVVSIKEHDRDNSVCYEMLLIKMENDRASRADILAAADAFDAKTVEYSKDSIIFRLTDDTRRIDDFICLMQDFKILEICRTGLVSLERGGSVIRDVTNY